MRIAMIDVETTSADTNTASIYELAMVLVEGHKIYDKSVFHRVCIQQHRMWDHDTLGLFGQRYIDLYKIKHQLIRRNPNSLIEDLRCQLEKWDCWNLGGQNIGGFDMAILKRYGLIDKRIRYNYIDVGNQYLATYREHVFDRVPSVDKCKELANYPFKYGNNRHSALDDALLEAELYCHVRYDKISYESEDNGTQVPVTPNAA